MDLDDELRATRRMNGSGKNVGSIEKLIEELTKVRPDKLSKDGLKLFKYINEIIDRNKELEEENEIYKEELEKIDKVLNLEEGRTAPHRYEIIESFQRGITQLKKIIDNSIPVSLVEEKIEELDIKITYIESQYTNGGQNCNSNYLSALYQKQILQELLEKR